MVYKIKKSVSICMRVLTSLKLWCLFFVLRQFVFGASEIKRQQKYWLKIFCPTELWRCFVFNASSFSHFTNLSLLLLSFVCVFWKIFCLFFHEKWNVNFSIFRSHDFYLGSLIYRFFFFLLSLLVFQPF